jgi:flagellar hook-associated protein 3 FlgL
MPLRVPDITLTQTALSSMARNSVRLAQLNAQVSAGKRILTPADDAVAYARAKGLRGVLTATAQYQDNIGRAQERLSVAESTLSSMEDLLAQAKELAIQQANPTYDASQRATMAQQAQQLIDGLVNLGNTEVEGQHIFAGYATGTAPFDATGAYLGDSGVRNVEVGDGVLVSENLTGDQFLKGGGTGVDAFAVLTQLRDGLAANDVTAISGTIDSLDTAVEQVTRARMTTGFRLNSLETHKNNLDETTYQTQQLLSGAEDLDYTQAVTELVQRQNTLDVARNTLAKILGGSSIMDLIG